jgi:hypothetical protein
VERREQRFRDAVIDGPQDKIVTERQQFVLGNQYA